MVWREVARLMFFGYEVVASGRSGIYTVLLTGQVSCISWPGLEYQPPERLDMEASACISLFRPRIQVTRVVSVAISMSVADSLACFRHWLDFLRPFHRLSR